MELAKIDRSKNWTLEEYLLLGEDFGYQLIDGKLIMSPSPSLTHQRVTKRLERIFDSYTTKFGGEFFHAPIDVYLDERNVYQPDVILISSNTVVKLNERGLEGAPELVVEILSPSNSHIDRYQKRELYQKFGVKEYWIVDPKNQSIEILNFGLDAHEPVLYAVEEGEVKSTLFPELTFELSTIF